LVEPPRALYLFDSARFSRKLFRDPRSGCRADPSRGRGPPWGAGVDFHRLDGTSGSAGEPGLDPRRSASSIRDAVHEIAYRLSCSPAALSLVQALTVIAERRLQYFGSGFRYIYNQALGLVPATSR
jgi:hypothetical protein